MNITNHLKRRRKLATASLVVGLLCVPITNVSAQGRNEAIAQTGDVAPDGNGKF